MQRPSLAVVWVDEESPAPALGRLSMRDGRVTLEGADGTTPRSYAFDAPDVEACELVASQRARLNGRPTLAVALKDRGRLLVAGVIGFGQTADIADYIAHWRLPMRHLT